MKFRQDYVTNSSSSSFVIAMKDAFKLDDETLKRYPFLEYFEQFINHILYTDGGYCDSYEAEVFTTKEEYDKHFVEEYSWSKAQTIEEILKEDDFLEPEYKEALKYLEQGYKIFCKSVDYNDESFRQLVKTMKKDKDNFIVIVGDE